MTAREQRRQRLRAFLDTIRRPTKALDGVDDQFPLVASGLIDSLSVLEIIAYLEREEGLDFSGAGIRPEDLRTVGAILDLIERLRG